MVAAIIARYMKLNRTFRGELHSTKSRMDLKRLSYRVLKFRVVLLWTRQWAERRTKVNTTQHSHCVYIAAVSHVARTAASH